MVRYCMSYTAKDISVLEGLSAVRKRPGMYIGDPTYAILQMLFEVIDNAVDEFLAGHCDEMRVYMDGDVFSVEDNGRGIPIDIHPTAGIPALELILSTLHSGGKFGQGGYKYSGGLHGVGVSVTNALSSWFEAEVYLNGKIHFIRFEQGVKACEMKIIGDTEKKGTKITFCPDFSILEAEVPSYNDIIARLEEIAVLNRGLKIVFENEGIIKELKSSGIVEFIGGGGLMDPIEFSKEDLEVAFVWKNDDREHYLTFTNGIRQRDGGTHLTGFKSAISNSIAFHLNKMGKKHNVLPEDTRMGLYAAVSLKLMEPQFSSQTKDRLVSSSARALVENFISTNLRQWLEEHPKETNIIFDRIFLAAKTRENLSKVKEDTRKNFKVALPAKLADCQSEDPAISELYIVEGDSAGGSARLGRDRAFQAILPLRGKLLNVERSTPQKIFNSAEIMSLAAALGTGIGSKFNIEKLRYFKIIIMTDADIDGLHIFTLIVIFFIKFMPEVIQRGHLYIARPPLFKVNLKGKKSVYIQDKEELNDFQLKLVYDNAEISQDGEKVDMQRLAEMFQSSKDFLRAIRKKNKNIDLNLVSMVLSASRERLMEHFENNIILEEEERHFKVTLKSIYGTTKYTILKVDEDFSFNPVKIGGQTCISPIDFVNCMEEKFQQYGYVQRYKGLGEMDAAELAETSLEKDKRVLDKLSLPEDRDEMEYVIDECKRIMGMDSDRKEFILRSLRETFGMILS